MINRTQKAKTKPFNLSTLNEIKWSYSTFLNFVRSILDFAKWCSNNDKPFTLLVCNIRMNLFRDVELPFIPNNTMMGFIKVIKNKDSALDIEITDEVLTDFEFPFVLIFVGTGFSTALLVNDFHYHRNALEFTIEGGFTISHPIVKQISRDVLNFPINDYTGEMNTDVIQSSLEIALNTIDQDFTKKNDTLHRISLSNQFISKIAWELDFNRLLGKIADGLHQAVQYELLEIVLYEKVMNKIVEKFRFRRNESKFGGHNLTIELNPSVVKAIYRHRHAVYYEDLIAQGAAANPKLIHITELKKAVILPLVKDRRVQGIIKLFFKPTTKLDQKDIEWLSEMAHHITKSMISSKAHEDATRLASNDALTGVANRRLFNEQFAREFKRYRRFGGELTVMMVDVDFFKMYNDREGHLQGDQVLKGVAQVLSMTIRQTDFLARYGGEEFAIILPGTSLSGAGVLAKKINHAISDFKFVNSEKQPFGCITVSIGVSSVVNGAVSPEDLLHQADMALYYAKENGRNRTYLYIGNGRFVTPEALEKETSRVVTNQIPSTDSATKNNQ